MAKCFKFGLDKHKDRKCIGTRKLLTEEDEVQPNGKVFKKWKMGEYSWNSYVDVDELSTYFGKGLRELGQLYRQNICIFADTRAEWMVAAQAELMTGSNKTQSCNQDLRRFFLDNAPSVKDSYRATQDL